MSAPLSPEHLDRLADQVVARLRGSLPPEPLAVGEADAARMLGISTRTLFSLRQTSDIPHCLVGARVLYPVAELRQWLAARVVREGTA